jgi:hypothetical protein
MVVSVVGGNPRVVARRTWRLVIYRTASRTYRSNRLRSVTRARIDRESETNCRVQDREPVPASGVLLARSSGQKPCDSPLEAIPVYVRVAEVNR